MRESYVEGLATHGGPESCAVARKSGGEALTGVRQPVTALTVVMARHHRSVEPQARQACYGRDHPVNDSEVSERHRPPATALTVIMALHHRSVEPQTRQACYGRGQPVNDSDVIEHYRQPTTALTVMMALHPHLINPNHHLPRATQKSQRRFWPRAPCHARLCDRLNLRASPLTSHCAGGRRGASSAFAEPLTVQSLASAATLSTPPSPRPAEGTHWLLPPQPGKEISQPGSSLWLTCWWWYPRGVTHTRDFPPLSITDPRV